MDVYALLCDYSTHFPQEVLRVEVWVEEEEDLWLIYRGQVSSLMRATPSDVGVSLWTAHTRLGSIDIIRAPYDPVAPVLLAEGVSLATLQARLKA